MENLTQKNWAKQAMLGGTREVNSCSKYSLNTYVPGTAIGTWDIFKYETKTPVHVELTFHQEQGYA